MRRLLVSRAHRMKAEINGGKLQRENIDEIEIEIPAASPDELLEVNEALQELSSRDALTAQVVELRYFSGFTEAEVAELLEISERTVRRKWEFARAWLYDALKKA